MNRARNIQQCVFFLSALGIGILFFSGIKLPQEFLVMVLAVLVAVIGLPHGALDPLVARKAGLWRTTTGLTCFIAVYLLLAGAAGLLWFWAPGLSLVAFLTYSAWHFAGDWREWLSSKWRLCAGATVICAPSLLHPDLVTNYFSLLTGGDASSLVRVIQWLAIPALAGTFLSAIRCARTQPVVTTELAVLAISAVALPPLIFFLLYFCGLHSPRHLIATAKGLNRSLAASTAIGLTLLTVALATVIFVVSPSAQVDQRLLQITFIGLAVLTVPHVILIEHYASRERRA